MPVKEDLLRTKASPGALNAKITQRLRRMGFATSKSYSSLFIRRGRLGPVSILLYVDDLVIIGADLGEMEAPACDIFRHEGSGGPSLVPQDQSDLHPRRHTDQPMPLCVEYALQI